MNNNPILLVIVFILVIGIVFQIIVLAMTYSKLGILILYAVIGWSFHNGPDSINIDEFYLRKIVCENPQALSGHDVLFIQKAISDFKSWSRVHAFFGISFILSIFLTSELLFIELLFLSVLGFLYLGYKYEIGRAIFR